MSHSTEIKISVGSSCVSYTFGSGYPADRFGVTEVRKPKMISGDKAREMIHSEEALLPDDHMWFVTNLLKEHDKETELVFSDQEDKNHPSYLVSRNDVHICITRFD